MPSAYLIALLLLVLAVLLALLSARASPSNPLYRLRQRLFPPPPPPASTGVTIIHNGEEFPAPAQPAPTARLSERIEAAGNRRRLVLVAMVAVLAVLATWQLYRFTIAPAPEQFVVLVAPFQEPGGAVGATGREVAATLVAGLPGATGQRVIARGIGDPPADAAAAQALLARENADALLWGTIAAGGMLDRETLQPLLAYRPSGPTAAQAWAGYPGRFAMPGQYSLANGQLSGAAVLPPLLGALADYNNGHIDAAYDTLGQLMSNYPMLAPTLPRALRGNILWARGEYQEAANEYGAALRTASPGEQAALLANNLGAIRQDAGDAAAAADSFNQAIAALQNRDLGALRYNLGLQALATGNSADAVTMLEIARTPDLLGGAAPPAALLLSISEAYRQNGQFEQARTLIAGAKRQIAADTAATTAEARNSLRARLEADAEMQRSLLDLAESANARGPLLWELLGSDTLSMQQLDTVRDDLAQTVDDTSVVAQLWTRLATTKDAAGELVAGQVATNQAQLAQAQLRERQRWLALVELERGSLQAPRRQGGLASIWVALAGDRSPSARGRAILEDLLKSQPSDVDTLVLLGNSQLINGQPDDALAQFGKAAALAPGRPEPVYGQGLATLAKGDRGNAKRLFNQTITINPAFFPARQRLATLAQEDGDWATVAEQRRWFAQNRPSLANTLALADALRRGGPAGMAQAEQLLLPLANQNNTDAMIALSGIYQQHGDAEGARQMLERAQRVAPGDSNVAFQYGKLLEAQNDQDGALAAYNHAIELDGANTQARLALGRLYAARGQTAEAGQQYEIALRAGANDPRELQRIGDVLLENGEYDTAATAYERAIAARTGDTPPAPDDTADPNAELANLYHGLGQANLKRGELAAAESAEKRALELRNNAFAAALVGLGDIALQRGDPRTAIEQYNAAIKLDGQLVPAYIGLGRAAGAQDQWSVAQAHFSDAVRVNSGSAEAHLWLGEALIRQGNPPAAIDQYVEALKLRENRYPEAYFGLAQAQIASGRPDLAKDNLALALQLKPRYPEGLLLQGKLFEQLGDTNAALGSYGKAIDQSDTLAEPYYRRALLYVRAGELDNAADDLESATKIQANFSEAHYWLGRVYLAQGKLKPARAEFVAAIEQRNGNFADARFYQGLAEEQLGQRSEAVQSYETALEQSGNSEWAGEARTALTRLRQP